MLKGICRVIMVKEINSINKYLFNHNQHNKFHLKAESLNNILHFDCNKTSPTHHIS